MQLKELLEYNDIVIQCHDNPDADTLATGYALYWYLGKMGKEPRLIYRGKNEIQKSNLLIMIDSLEIPLSYEPEFSDIPELIVMVDCQYGQQNVTKTEAQNVAVIDHHQRMTEPEGLSEIRSQIGSCSTVIWDMLRDEGVSVDENTLISTALYYGLYTDTKQLSEVSHPLDRDMRDSLFYNKSIIREMSNSNISLDELKITGKAILDYQYFVNHRYLIIKADQCDPNILGVISDFSMETSGVDICISYYVSEQEIKFSVRSCTREVHANELAVFLSDGIGGGGGHLTKAGGTIRPERLMILADERYQDLTTLISDEFNKRLNEYFNMFDIIYAKKSVLDTSDMKLYEKQPQLLGCLKLTDVFPENTMIEIRTLEGDINLRIAEDTYLMIGLEGEVYPITREKLERSYKAADKAYDRTFEYEPHIRNLFTGEKKTVLKYARGVISTGKTRIFAKPLDTHVKLFTVWDDEKYYSGDPGDYIAVREDDEHDMYIIRKRFFDQLYKEADA